MATKKRKTTTAKKSTAEKKIKPWGRMMPYDFRQIVPEATDLYDDQAKLVEKLESDFEFEKAKLLNLQEQITAHAAKLRALSFTPKAIRKFDPKIKELASRLEYKSTSYSSGKRVEKPTGAVRWDELRRNGATDAQIKRNLECVEAVKNHYYSSGYHFAKTKDQYSIAEGGRDLVKGTAKVVAEIRRIFSIPLPVESATMKKPSPAKKKSPLKKRGKSPAKTPAPKKPAAAAKKPPAKNASIKPVVDAIAKLNIHECKPADLLKDSSTVSHAKRMDAVARIKADPDAYVALKKRLRKKPTTDQVIKKLQGAAVAEAEKIADDLAMAVARVGGNGALSKATSGKSLVDFATGKAPSKKTAADANFDSALDPDFDKDEIAARKKSLDPIARGDAAKPTVSGSLNGATRTKAKRTPRKDSRRRMAVA